MNKIQNKRNKNHKINMNGFKSCEFMFRYLIEKSCRNLLFWSNLAQIKSTWFLSIKYLIWRFDFGWKIELHT